MSIFDNYDDEFNTLAAEIGNEILSANYENHSEKKRRALDLIQGKLDQAQDLLKQMEVEARSLETPEARRTVAEKVQEHKKTVKSLRRDYSDMRKAEEHATLLGVDENDPSAEQRSRLVQANDKLDRSSQRLRHALDIVADTESTALEINDELARNREKIENIHTRVRSVSSLADSARRLIHTMNKREIQTRIILAVVALAMFIAVAVVVSMFAKK